MKLKNTVGSDVVKTFKKHVHQNKYPRGGLAYARAAIHPNYFPRIVSALGSQPIYRSLFAPSTFPQRLDLLTRKPRLGGISEEAEFVWTACVLNLFEPQICLFVELRDKFYELYVGGLYSEAEKVLDTIENSLGFSLWLIQYRLQLLQIHEGMKSQKDYVEALLSTNNINSFSAWLAYFFSLRSEENVSFSRLHDEVADIIPGLGLGDYVLTHVLPYDLTTVTHPFLPVNWEEPNPIVDRYETFVSMIQVQLVRNRATQSSLLNLALEQLKKIPDSRLRRLDTVLSETTVVPDDSKIIAAADLYTRGSYDKVLDADSECLELVARARILGNIPADIGKGLSFKSQIIGAMQEILTLSSNAQQHRLHLKKISLSCPRHPYSIQIASFLERQHDFVLVKAYSDLDYFSSINAPLENPWNSPLIAGFKNRDDWLEKLEYKYPNSESIKLRRALCKDASKEHVETLSSSIPDHRYSVYQGHIAFGKDDITAAIDFYGHAINHSNEFVSAHAKKYMYDAHFAAKNYKECLALVVNHVLVNPTAVFAYRISELATVCLGISEFHTDINFAILLHLNVVHVNPKWERELSDIFENVLFVAGVDKPSELEQQSTEFEERKMIYFLRNVCIQRLLDDTTCFENVDEIEEERIAICQLLLSLDPENKEEYLSEIRGITRDTDVAHLFNQVQSSKIYVDEAGLRQSFETSLLDTFLRYKKLLDSPVLAYQAEKLSRRLEEMLSAKGNTEIRDLKLPASEREALFSTLLFDFVQEFAFNPAYGLDTHVSTTIRHGAFEGHIRTPFAAEDLLCRKQDNEYVLPVAWKKKLENFSPEELESIRRPMGRFTAKVEELISFYLSQKIRVREDGNEGMFIMNTNLQGTNALRESITNVTEYSVFLDKFFAHSWLLVNQSMEFIREDLQDDFLNQITTACDSLVSAVSQSFGRENISSLIDAVVRAQTAFQVAVIDVAEWFKRPKDLSRDPFDFEVAVRVAMKQIKNCYVDTPIDPKLDLQIKGKIEGRYVDGICEIFYILLQNVILHGGYKDQDIQVSVSAQRIEEQLVITCTNQLSDDIDLDLRKRIADEAITRYERDTAMKLARQEGGSGLSKIWRIAEYDLMAQHTVSLQVHDNRSFTSTVTLSGIPQVPNVDIYH